MGLVTALMQPAVDPQSLAALRELNPEDPGFLRELIDTFLDDMPRRFDEIDRALAAQDAELLTRAAHTIKGSCSNFGATHLAHLALEMEKQGKAAAFADATAALPALKAEFARVRTALEQHR